MRPVFDAAARQRHGDVFPLRRDPGAGQAGLRRGDPAGPGVRHAPGRRGEAGLRDQCRQALAGRARRGMWAAEHDRLWRRPVLPRAVLPRIAVLRAEFHPGLQARYLRVAGVLGWADAKFELLRQKLPSCKRLFNDIKTLTSYLCFDSWEDLMDFMLESLNRPPLKLKTG